MHANQFYSVSKGTGQPEGTCIGLQAWDGNFHSFWAELGWISLRDCAVSRVSICLSPRIA